MRIVLNTFGSFGDIHPYMALAMEELIYAAGD
jgi:hypothetical protein